MRLHGYLSARCTHSKPQFVEVAHVEHLDVSPQAEYYFEHERLLNVYDPMLVCLNHV